MHILLLALACNKGQDDTGTPEPVLTVALDHGDVTLDDTDLAWPGIVGAPNIDDDDADGENDFLQALSGQADRTSFDLMLPHKTDIALSGDTANLRIWQDDAVLLDADGTTAQLAKTHGEWVTLQAEFGDYMVAGALTLTDTVTGDVLEVSLSGAPFMMNHHLQPSTQIMAVAFNYRDYSNADMVSDYKAVLGDMYLDVSSNTYQDPWIQDEIEFGTAVGPDWYLDVVFDTIRNGQGQGGLTRFATNTYESEDNWDVAVWGEGRATSQDYGGNLEAMPPNDDYPLGRIYYGSQGRYAPHDDVEAMFDAMQVQAPFKLDSSWLCVGHVDEWVTTIPWPGSRLGWKLVITDVDRGIEVLESMDPDTPLTRFASDKHIDTVGDILDDAQLIALNNRIQSNEVDPSLDTMIDAMGLTDEDIYYLPGMWETVQGCGGTVAALWPGMANMIVGTAPDGTTTLFIPDPMLRTNVNNQDSDAMIQVIRDELPSEFDLVFMDDWDVYHMQLGEVHCGSNVVREPAEVDWWVDAKHLMTPPAGER
jgi:protein-arginine deiminase